MQLDTQPRSQRRWQQHLRYGALVGVALALGSIAKTAERATGFEHAPFVWAAVASAALNLFAVGVVAGMLYSAILTRFQRNSALHRLRAGALAGALTWLALAVVIRLAYGHLGLRTTVELTALFAALCALQALVLGANAPWDPTGERV